MPLSACVSVSKESAQLINFYALCSAARTNELLDTTAVLICNLGVPISCSVTLGALLRKSGYRLSLVGKQASLT